MFPVVIRVPHSKIPKKNELIKIFSRIMLKAPNQLRFPAALKIALLVNLMVFQLQNDLKTVYC